MDRFWKKIYKIKDKGTGDKYESMWVLENCPHCGGNHRDIEDGIPDNVDGGCPMDDEGIMGWALKGIRKIGKWRITKSPRGLD